MPNSAPHHRAISNEQILEIERIEARSRCGDEAAVSELLTALNGPDSALRPFQLPMDQPRGWMLLLSKAGNTIRAGFPSTRARWGTALITRDPGPMVAPLPIETGPRIFVCAPIHTPSPIVGPQGSVRDPILVP